jgi:hypothetical protein
VEQSRDYCWNPFNTAKWVAPQRTVIGTTAP